MVYRFVGTESHVGPTTMRRFGQRFNMSEEVAKTVIKGGCALIPEDQFNALGFTEEDMKVWSDPMVQDGDIPNKRDEAQRKMEFLRKRKEARAIYIALRHSLLEPKDQPKPDDGKPMFEASVITEMPEEMPAITEVAEEA